MQDMMIQGESYQFVTNYQHDENLRKSFNKLTQNVYGFNFEKWYQSGYWDDHCLLYSLADNGRIVSHVTVTVIDFTLLGEQKKYVQLGTIMTDEKYRGQGLSRALLEVVINEWTCKCDLIYLFANDDVLDFYPRFGFIPVHEYEASKRIFKKGSPYTVRKMDIEQTSDRDLLYETAKNPFPLFKLSMDGNPGLIMFYSNYFDHFSVSENLYYIENLQTIAIVDYDEDILMIYDILAPEKINIDDVIHALAKKQSRTAIIGSIPINSGDYDISLFKEDDSTLFVMADQGGIFGKNKLCFPILSHT